MDHLSRVSAQSSRNKMNPHNLAICFAPVLMMDVNSSSRSGGGGGTCYDVELDRVAVAIDEYIVRTHSSVWLASS